MKSRQEEYRDMLYDMYKSIPRFECNEDKPLIIDMSETEKTLTEAWGEGKITVNMDFTP